MDSRVGLFNRCTPSKSSSGPRIRIWVAVLCIFLVLPTLSAFADQYSYRSRGDRHEGIRPKPVGGDDIELISVRAVPIASSADAAPDRMRLAFFLPEAEQVRITVRELDYEYFYWMDQVHPPQAWQVGETNSFDWPTQDVLAWLFERGLRPGDLGAVVRLSDDNGSSVLERVAPAILSADQALVSVESYLFTFKTSFPAFLTCSLRREGADAPLWTKTFKRVGAGRPFSCKVPIEKLGKGDHRLEVDGYSLDTNAPVWQEVRFYHSPDLR
jgi:hypothetical protein